MNTEGILGFKIEKTGVRTTIMDVGTVVSWDPHDAVRLGITALPAANATDPGGLFTRGTGAGQINQSNNGQIDVDVLRWRGSTPNILTSGRVDASVGAIVSSALSAIASAVWGFVVEGAHTATGYMRLIASSTVWKVSGFATNAPRYRDAADSKDRIVGATTADGRTSVTVDAS